MSSSSAEICEGTAPSFTPLGHYRLRYFFRAQDGEVVWYDCRTLARLGAALTLIPDISHWRRLYPREGRPGQVDWEAVGAALIRLAKAAGPYEPQFGEGPSQGGRRPYTPAERLEAYQRRRAARKVSTLVAEAAGLTNPQMQRRERERRQRETPAG